MGTWLDSQEFKRNVHLIFKMQEEINISLSFQDLISWLASRVDFRCLWSQL